MGGGAGGVVGGLAGGVGVKGAPVGARRYPIGPAPGVDGAGPPGDVSGAGGTMPHLRLGESAWAGGLAALALLSGPTGCAWVTDAELAAATKGAAAAGADPGPPAPPPPLDGLWYRDADGDGFGRPDDSERAAEAPDGYVDNADDCDDSSAAVYPGAPETCADDVDQDCDGFDVLECRPEGELLLDAGDADLVLTGASGANIGYRMAAVDLDLDGHDELLLSDSTVGVQVVPGPLAPATSASVASRASGAFLETDALLAYQLGVGPAGQALLTLGMDHPSTFVDSVGGVALLGAEDVGAELDVDAVLVVGDAAGQFLGWSGAAWVDGAAGPLLLVADSPSDVAAQRLHVFADPVTRRAAGLLEAGDADARVGPHSWSGITDRGIGERAFGCDLDGSGESGRGGVGAGRRIAWGGPWGCLRVPRRPERGRGRGGRGRLCAGAGRQLDRPRPDPRLRGPRRRRPRGPDRGRPGGQGEGLRVQRRRSAHGPPRHSPRRRPLAAADRA